MSLFETSPGEPDRSAPATERTAAEFRLGLAQLAILWERFWPALWPATATAGVFLTLAFFDVFRYLPGWVHLGVLVLFVIAAVYGLVRAFATLRAPGIAAARRRVERSSGLVHRPLTSLADQLASGGNDPAAAALWQAHRARMEAATKRLRVGAPQAGLAAIDPFGLRAALLLLLLVAVIGAGDQWSARLRRAVTPGIAGSGPVVPPSLDIWLTPPEYTGLAPQFLQRDHQGDTVAVPIGSTVLAQVHGGHNPPTLKLDDAATDFARVDPQNFKISTKVTDGHKLAIEQDGGVVAAWPIRVIPDVPPKIELATPPQPTQRGALRLEYHATDDYGVESVKAIIIRSGGSPDEKIEIDLPLPASAPQGRQGRELPRSDAACLGRAAGRAEARRDRRARPDRREPAARA